MEKEIEKMNNMLKNKISCSSYRLKHLLFKHKIKPSICEKCNISEWNKRPISLQIHHKDGNNKNNLIENLQILCPNCHSQTDNYGSKNRKNKKEVRKYLSDDEICQIILNSYTKRQVLLKCGLQGSGGNYTRINNIILKYDVCLKSRNKKDIINAQEEIDLIEQKNINYVKKSRKSKINWPDNDILINMIKSTPVYKLAKQLGVSDNAVKKHIKKHHLDIKLISPWAKKNK